MRLGIKKSQLKQIIQEVMGQNKLDQVTPPGYQKVVRGLKKSSDVDNPWAVRWSMKNKGIKPKK